LAERTKRYEDLREKIKGEGFDFEQPITIQLLRKAGTKDQIKDGHHRFAIALELNISQIPVRFLFASTP